jgi:hypothetical protein
MGLTPGSTGLDRISDENQEQFNDMDEQDGDLMARLCPKCLSESGPSNVYELERKALRPAMNSGTKGP